MAALVICGFENQRWIRARISGFEGSSVAFGLFIDWTGIICTVFQYAFIAWAFYAHGARHGGVLVAVLFLAPLLSSAANVLVTGKADTPLVWLVGTVLVWPLMLALVVQP